MMKEKKCPYRNRKIKKMKLQDIKENILLMAHQLGTMYKKEAITCINYYDIKKTKIKKIEVWIKK